MKWVLVSFQGDLGSFGVRYISSCLRAAGFETQILFIPHRSSKKLDCNWVDTATEFILEQRPDVIGISLMCCHFHNSLALTESLKARTDRPVVWGGLHPTICPEECIAHCDMLCRGEGEEAVVDLTRAMAAGREYSDTLNFWFRDGTTVIRNPLADRPEDLDRLPFPDYDFSHQSILHGSQIHPMTYDLARHYPPYNRDTHFVFSSRGCSFQCSYCCSPLVAKLAGGPYLRRREPKQVVSELEEALERFSQLKCIMFCDDDFIAADAHWQNEFSELYTEKIGLPFMCAGNPVHIDAPTLDRLTRTGLVGLGAGIQSYSETVRRTIFNRQMSDQRMDKAIEDLARFDDAIKAICYDFIVDFPGDTNAFKKENIRRLNRLKRNFTINIFPFTAYPGTAIAEDLPADHPARDGIYRLSNPYEPAYLNRLLRITPDTSPRLVSLFLQDDRPGIRFLFKLYYAYYAKVKRPASVVRLMAQWYGNALLDRLAFRRKGSSRFDSFKFEH